MQHKNITKILYKTVEKGRNIQREMIVINGYAFYRSSGTSSGLPGIWLPFMSVTKEGIEKPPGALCGGLDRESLNKYFGNDEKLIDLLVTLRNFRFSNLDGILLSIAIDEKSWDNVSPKLKNIKDYVSTTEPFKTRLMSFKEIVKTQNIQSEQKDSVALFDEKENFNLDKLNLTLKGMGQIYCNSDNFPEELRSEAPSIKGFNKKA